MTGRQRCSSWLSVCWLVVYFWLPTLGVAQERQADGVVTDLPSGQVDWAAGQLQSIGYAAAVGRVTQSLHVAQAYAQALRAARQRLFQALTHLRFDATRTVGQVLQESAQHQQAVQGLVEVAPVVQTRYGEGGRVESTVQLSLFGPLTTMLLPEGETTLLAKETMSDTVYTGIVIDARGLSLQAALFPRILDEEAHVLYAPQVVNPEIARHRGYVAYSAGVPEEQTPTRVGAHPLIIRARRVAGEARVDVVLSHAEAERIRQYGDTPWLFQQCRVLIVK